MIDKGPFSFHHDAACTVFLLILSYFIFSVSNVPSVQIFTQEVYGNPGIGDNITKESSTQVTTTQNTTASGSDNQVQQSIENMTKGPAIKINSTSLIAASPEESQSKRAGNNTTNGTVIVIPPRPVQSNQTLNEPSIIGPPRIIQSNPQSVIESGDMSVNSSALKPITKEQAAKAEQEANIMIKAYYEKLEQEKQIQKEREQAAALAASAQTNQTMDNAIQTEGSQGDIAALAEEPVTDIEEDAQQEGEVEAEEDEESDNENEENENENNEQDDD